MVDGLAGSELGPTRTSDAYLGLLYAMEDYAV